MRILRNITVKGSFIGSEKMGTLMRKCESCNEYTLMDVCKNCGAKTVVPAPARFSPEDRYGKYRRMLRRYCYG